MKIDLYEKYRLKDGRTGWIIEVLGQGEAYMVEVDKKGLEDRIITVQPDDIGEKLS